MISMPSIVALSVTVLKLMTICPDAFAVAVKSRTTALKAAPAAAKMSKFDSTVVPLIRTLKTRFPAAVWNSSAKCRRTVYEAEAVRPGKRVRGGAVSLGYVPVLVRLRIANRRLASAPVGRPHGDTAKWINDVAELLRRYLPLLQKPAYVFSSLATRGLASTTTRGQALRYPRGSVR